MSIQAKFKCISVTDFGSSKQVSLQAVTGKGNDDFCKYTPSGEFKMQITEDTKAFGFFVPNEVYVLDITKVASV